MNDAQSDVRYLDELIPVQMNVGYGELGTHGALGYEGLSVVVQGQPYQHALSAHAPARLVFDLGARFASFCCQVALNDDVPAHASHAHFTVLADGRIATVQPFVTAGDPPRELRADMLGVKQMELVVQTDRWEFCHSVWLDPKLSEQEGRWSERSLPDCLGRADITRPATPLRAERCIATVVTPGYGDLLDNLLGSLFVNSACTNDLVAVLTVGEDAECAQVIAKYGAIPIPCTPLVPINQSIKSVLYSLAQVVDAWQFLCLDVDTLVLGDLRPIFAALDTCPPDSILVCRDAYLNQGNLQHQLCTYYDGKPEDLEVLLKTPGHEGTYPLVVNDGVFAASRGALLALDHLVRSLPQTIQWVDQQPNDYGWRNQFIFNLALARLDCGVELDPTFNLQVHMNEVEMRWENGRVQALWHGRPARILHFCGWGRQKYAQWRGLFARPSRPLVEQSDADGCVAP